MAACDDRQLSEAQRQAAFQQNRTAGVLRAVRPFTGQATPQNLVDYLNRELFPAVKANRQKTNDIFRQVTDNAPSANPLTYYFSTETANADPTAGRVRFDNAAQDAATTIRVSETNARLQDAAAWLDVMAGSATTPLGVVTLFDAVDPGRFIRFDLTAMTDAGSYWNLTVNPIEASHPDPFVDSEGIVISFIGGVSSAGSTVPPSALSPIANNTFVGNVSGATAAPVAVLLSALASTSIVFDAATHTFQRAGLTGGDIAASQNSNALTINNDAVTDAKLRNSAALSVIGRSANSSGDPADIATTSGSAAVLREASGVLGFGTVANAGLATMPDATVKGRARTSGTGVPIDLTGAQVGEIIRFATEQADPGGSGTVTTLVFAVTSTTLRWTPTGAVTVHGAAMTGPVTPSGGEEVMVYNSRTSSFNITFAHNSGSAADPNYRFFAPGNVDLILRPGDAATFRYSFSRWICSGVGRGALSDGDYGDITVTAGGATWTIDPNVVSDGKLRQGGALSVIGRSANSTGNVADIAATAASDSVLRESGSVLGFGTVATAGITNNAVTDAKLRQGGALTVVGRSANTTGNVADIAAVAASGSVLRESGSTLGFGTIATAGLANNSVTNAKLAQMAAGTYKGRLVTAGTGDPTDLSGTEATSGLRYAIVVDTTTTGTVTSYAPTGFGVDTTAIRISPSANVILRGMPLAVGQQIVIRVGRGSGFTVTLNHEDGSAVAGEAFNTPNNVALVMRAGEACIIRQGESRNNVVAMARTTVADADYGDITVTSNGATWTIDNDTISNAKLRDSGALSVIGRSANSSGDPADISAVAASDSVLRESGSVLGFGTIATAGIANNAVTDAKLRQGGALSVVGRSANTTGNVADIAAVAASGAVLRESGSTVGFGTIATAGIADDSVTNAKLANMASPTLKGRTTATTGDPEDLTPANSTSITWNTSVGGSISSERAALTGDVTASANANATTIAANAVTDAKFRQSAALSVVGRSANSTGNVADISAVAAGGGVLRESGSTIGFGTIALGAFPSIADDTFLANIAGSTTVPTAVALTTLAGAGLTGGADAILNVTAGSGGSLVVGANDIQRAALTGDVTATQDSNATTIANSAVTLAKMANLAQSTIIGRAEGAGTGVPTALTATQVATIIDQEAITWTALQTFSGSVIWNNDQVEAGSLPMNITLGDSVNKLFINTSGDGEIQTIGGTSTAGRIVKVYILTTGLKTFKHGSGTGAQRMFWPGNRDHVLGLRQSFELVGENTGTGWRVTNVPVEYTDKGDITVSSTGSTWTVDNDVITNAKLRDSAALSVIGRATNSSGDPADIAAGADDRMLARTSSALSFTQLTNGMVAVNTIGLDKLANILDNRWLGNVSGATGAVTANDLSSFNSTSIIYENTGKTFIRQALTGDVTASQNSNATTIATGAVTNTKIATNTIALDKLVTALDNRFLGNISGATGNVTAIDLASLNSTSIIYENVSKTFIRQALTGDVTALQNNNATSIAPSAVTTVKIADDAVTDAKLRNGAALSVIGRSANSSGDPADIATTNGSGAVLRESAGVLGFGLVSTANVTDDSITNGKLRDSGALSVIGRSANSSGDPADISGTASSDAVLRISGTSLGFGQVASAGIASNAVTNARLAQMAASTVKGRGASAGTGDPQDLTPNDVGDILSGATGTITWNGPGKFNDRIHLLSVLASSESAVNDKAIGDTTLWRVTATGSPTLITGMVASDSGQLTYICNASATNDLQILNNSGSSSAGNRFVLGTTAVTLTPHRSAAFWYDGSSGAWRCLDDYPV